MSSKSQRTEFSVGLFVLMGFLVLGWLLMHFVRSGGEPRGGYPITVEVRDATGVRSGVPVRFAGVEIGRVSGKPDFVENSTQLLIPLTIFPDRKIPVGSTVRIDTTGLMGDSYVRIQPPEKPTARFLAEGDSIFAEKSTTISDLTSGAGDTIEEVDEALMKFQESVGRLESIFSRLETKVLTDQNVDNLAVILSELRSSSENLNAASQSLMPLIAETQSAVSEVDNAAAATHTAFAEMSGSLDEFETTLRAINPVAAELDASLDDLSATLRSANDLMKKIDSGEGLASVLVNDGKLKKDLESFVDKLNENGLIFYPRENGPLSRILQLPGANDDEDRRRPSPTGNSRRP